MSTTSTRLHGDTRRLVVFVTVLVAVLGIVSFTAGVPGLMAVGAWALLPGWMSALVPVIVDGGILVFSLVAVVRRARGEGAVFAWSCLAILTLGSVAAQVAHVLLGSGSVAATAIAGAVVAGAFPSVVFASTHAILDLAIAPAPKRGKHAEDAPEQPAEARAVILRETPITRPAVNILGATSADGRVHPSFHAVGADTGRMSVSGPAIQNMPREGGVRGILRADEGHLLVTADLKEVEPRLAAILSGDERMKAMLASGRSPYIETAEIIWPGEEVTPERRAIAKTSLLATIYSQQPTGLAPRLGVTVERAAEIQQALRTRYPKLAEWSLGVRHSRGSLTSHFGRSILAPAKGPHARVNYVVQGSAADLFKRMALEVARQLGVASLWLPAHDELAAMVPEADAEQAAETLRHCMTVEIAGVAIFPSDPTTTDRWTK